LKHDHKEKEHSKLEYTFFVKGIKYNQ